jgi:UDP-N-acetylmuramyl pentapeptide phosphotransferase/UDP-N-acetylglucosamine-1-phosphate transferase
MFAIGIKDDILVISPKKKFLIQLLAALIIVICADIRVTNFHGALGIYAIDYWTSVIFSIFVITLITNALNLIDGIDGLSSSLTIIMSSFFAIWFFVNGNMDLVILATALIGSLGAFFYHNVYSRKTKVFMGDTGSLILGTILAVFAIEFNELNIENSGLHAFKNAPVVALGVLIIPLFDTLRIFIVRMMKGRSPFAPDKNHIHHMLLSLGLSHKHASLILALVNLAFVALVIAMRNIDINMLLYVIITIALLATYILSIISGHYKSVFRKLID